MIDNGKGIMPEDYEMLAQKHTTSKLEDFEGLEKLSSFGFRGEVFCPRAEPCDLSTF